MKAFVGVLPAETMGFCCSTPRGIWTEPSLGSKGVGAAFVGVPPGGGNGGLPFYARGQCSVLAKKDWLAFEVGLLFIIKYGMGVF